MASLSLRLFGTLTVEREGVPLHGLEASKVQELLAFLAINREHIHPREALATLLWSESSTPQARKFLRQVLWRLQAALNSSPSESSSERILDVRPDAVRLHDAAHFWLDTADFEETFVRARGIPGHSLSPRQASDLARVAGLYQGDLLEGWYQDWCLFERERLQNMFLSMLDKLVAYCEAHGTYEEGLAYGAQALRLDRSRELTHRQLMRLNYLAGDRTSALHQYRKCVAALEEELGVPPARATVELYNRICADGLDRGEPGPAGQLNPPAKLPESSLGDALLRLNQVQLVLADLQQQVQAEIHAIELSRQNR